MFEILSFLATRSLGNMIAVTYARSQAYLVIMHQSLLPKHQKITKVGSFFVTLLSTILFLIIRLKKFNQNLQELN